MGLNSNIIGFLDYFLYRGLAMGVRPNRLSFRSLNKKAYIDTTIYKVVNLPGACPGSRGQMSSSLRATLSTSSRL